MKKYRIIQIKWVGDYPWEYVYELQYRKWLFWWKTESMTSSEETALKWIDKYDEISFPVSMYRFLSKKYE